MKGLILGKEKVSVRQENIVDGKGEKGDNPWLRIHASRHETQEAEAALGIQGTISVREEKR